MFRFLYHHNHLCKSIIGQFHHEVDVLVLLFGKVLICLAFPVDGACQIITAVSDAFNFRYFAQHGTYLQLTFRTQTTFGYLIQVVGYFQFHVVADVLVFLYPAKQFVEVIILVGMQQVLHHPEHTMRTFGKQVNFFACLQDRKFRSRKHTTGDKPQARFLVFLLWTD